METRAFTGDLNAPVRQDAKGFSRKEATNEDHLLCFAEHYYGNQ
jgi:hypothetical protein